MPSAPNYANNLSKDYSNPISNAYNLPNSTASSNLTLLMGLNSPRSGNMISYTSFTADQAISWMNFCKCLANLSRILNNSNFERCHFAGSNCILEKMSFILLKNAAMKLYGFSELLTS